MDSEEDDGNTPTRHIRVSKEFIEKQNKRVTFF